MKKTYTPEEKKNLRHLFWRSGHFWANFNMVKMMGQTYAFCLFPILNEVYAGKEDLRREAMLRNTEFFNCNASMSGLCLGVSYALEKERAANPDSVSPQMITNIKTSLMGPLAAIGDSLFFNCIRVISGGIGIALASQGNPLGVVLFVAIYGGLFLALKWTLIKLGYGLGTNVITEAFHSGIIGMITQSACIMGLMMVGALVAQMVSVQIPLVVPMGGGAEMVVQTIFDEIMPGLLELGLLFGIVAILKRKWKPITVIALILVMAITGSFFGIF